ncbi:glycosyltransferase family 4 protein [Ginsengibacter hankyongi]|uniref:Glycosyltransferase family 4 protein n=1 Tax=Ginsengibacter hankyongi TaxID=2607284 RepID=A0A5J5IC37_9BACT|nr:glycosyltransferase family 4 protein [Ginsengibacter hankyongi]KAA9036372.1 glycosyltransferase family 4 protein [Ginsengibacter hankyongi]
MKILFLTLRTFSATGGIEKVCRIMGKALYEESLENNGLVKICSMYDKQEDAFDNPYFPAENFRGFGINKLRFIKETVHSGFKYDQVILSHINLLPVGWLIKKLSPGTTIILLAHGIEIWYPLNPYKKRMLRTCDKVIAVSNYTREQISTVHGIPRSKIAVLNNCLDPFLPLPSGRKKDKELLRKYGFSESDTILMSLTRLASRERYKGYDKVIEAIATMQARYPGIKYFIAGRYDSREKAFVEDLVKKAGMENRVVMPGFIPEEELKAHFAMSDIYVMPSRKEGFGIVFIEAMYYGLPVIAGNIDGSVDALLNGQLGQLVDPDSVEDIKDAIANIMEDKTSFTPSRKVLTDHFSYEAYKWKLEGILSLTPNPSPEGEGDRKPYRGVYSDPGEASLSKGNLNR